MITVSIFTNNSDFFYYSGGNNNITLPPITLTTVAPDCQFLTFFDNVRTSHTSPDLQLGNVSLDECKGICRITPGCVAFDWDKTTHGCVGM